MIIGIGAIVALFSQDPPVLLLATGAAVVAFVVPVLFLVRPQGSSAVIYTRIRAEAATFWERNRDQIYVNAVFLVIGAALGVVTTLIFSP